MMDIRDAATFLRSFGLKISDSGIRAATRRSKIQGVTKNSENGTYDFSKNGLIDYLLKQEKLSNFDVYRLGYYNAVEEFEDQVIDSRQSDRKYQSYLFATLDENKFHYICSNFWNGFNHFYVKIDTENSIIHLLDDLEYPGTSAINLASENLIYDILKKLNLKVTKDDLEKQILLIYTSSKSLLDNMITTFGYSHEENKFDFHIKDKDFVEKFADKDFIPDKSNSKY